MNKIYFSKLNDKAIIPSKKDEDAGYDIYACFDEDFIIIKPFETHLVPTGIAWACPPEYYMQIEERSSTGTKGIKKGAGILDSGYRGEIKIAIYNSRTNNLILSNLEETILKQKYPEIFKESYLYYNTNKAIAQGIIHRVEKFDIQELTYDNLLSIPSERGTNGWGSSGK